MTTHLLERPTLAGGAARRLRLVVPEHRPERGGVAARVAALASLAAAQGHDVVVATQHAAGPDLPEVEVGADGVLVRRFASAGTVRDQAISPGLWRWLREGADRADVVHVHDLHALTSLLALSVAPRPVLLTPHLRARTEVGADALARQAHATAARRALARVSRVICATPCEARAFVARLGAADRVVVHPEHDDAATLACHLSVAPVR